MNTGIHCTLVPAGSFLLGGVSYDPAYDLLTAERDGAPYVPATALKGAIRMEFEAFVRALQNDLACDLHKESGSCGVCLTCRLFGGHSVEGKFRFEDAILEDVETVFPQNSRSAIWKQGERQGVSISRNLGKSKEGSYFNFLTFPNVGSDFKFTTFIRLTQPLDPEELLYCEAFFTFLEKTGFFIGARKSSGLGHFHMTWQLENSRPAEGSVATSNRALQLFSLELETLEPIVLGGLWNQYLLDTLPYIPASALGGSIGFGLDRFGISPQEITRVFLEDRTLSPLNCYSDCSLPRPHSILAQKGDKRERDVLLPDFLVNLGIAAGAFQTVRPLFDVLYRSQLRPIPRCKQPDTRFNTKLAMNRNLGKGQESMLYSLETIARGTHFQGLVIAESWVADCLLDMNELLIGGKRNRGFGRVRIASIEAVADDFLTNPTVDIDGTIRRLAGDYNLSLPEGRTFYSLDLLNDQPVANSSGFKQVLERELFEGTGLRVEHSFAGMLLRGSFGRDENGQSREKPLQERLAAGSCFLVSVPEEKTPEFLARIRDMIARSGQFSWDQTPLFMADNPAHLDFWRNR